MHIYTKKNIYTTSSPLTCTKMEWRMLPKTLLAMQTYSPASSSDTLTSFSVLLKFSNFTFCPGRSPPFLNHLIVGVGLQWQGCETERRQTHGTPQPHCVMCFETIQCMTQKMWHRFLYFPHIIVICCTLHIYSFNSVFNNGNTPTLLPLFSMFIFATQYL